LIVRKWPWAALFLVVVLPLAGAAIVHRFEPHLGLIGTYFREANWQQPAFTVIDSTIAMHELQSRFEAFGPNPFSVSWRGFLAVEKEGRYDFATRSDDASLLFVDGALIVDNGGTHGPWPRVGTVVLSAGFHPVELKFQQFGGSYDLELAWRPEGRPAGTIPRSALLSDEPTSWQAYQFMTWTRQLFLLVPFAWLVLVEVWLLRRFAGSLWRFIGRPSSTELTALGAVLAVSALLNVIGLTWGLPGRGSWAIDEVLPSLVLDGMAHGFSGGWHSRYPMFHYFILAAAYAPFRLLSAIANADADVYAELVWVNRLMCVQMAMATLVVIYTVARQLRGHFAGLVAVATAALVPGFVYYSKVSNLEIPYTFWSVCAVACYGRALLRGSPGDYWRFALFATFAVCTKDQAYALFILPSFHMAIVRARQLGRDAEGRWWRVAVDPVLGGAVLVAAIAFAVSHNLLFNWTGFAAHMKMLTYASGYRAFPVTLQGEAQLLLSSLAQVRWIFGWPMAGVVGLAVLTTLLDRRAWPRLWLLVPVVSSYALLIAVVLYNYDRFFLPICVLLAVLVGCWAEDLRERVAQPRLRLGLAAAAAVVAVYTFAYAASVDSMMLFDARYSVEDWIARNVPASARIGTAGSIEYIPRISSFQQEAIGSDSIRVDGPEFVVINAEHMRRYPPDTDMGRLFAALQTGSGYRLVLQQKTAVRFAPLAAQPEIANRVEDGLTNLDKINPETLVFQKIEPGHAPSGPSRTR
jgi:hypothetical protein